MCLLKVRKASSKQRYLTIFFIDKLTLFAFGTGQQILQKKHEYFSKQQIQID